MSTSCGRSNTGNSKVVLITCTYHFLLPPSGASNDRTYDLTLVSGNAVSGDLSDQGLASWQASTRLDPKMIRRPMSKYLLTLPKTSLLTFV
jgi:hypothetical protein